jgi:hypothetical protein
MSPKTKPVANPAPPPPMPGPVPGAPPRLSDAAPIIMSIQAMIQHIQQHQLKPEPEDSCRCGQFVTAHATDDGGHPGSTCAGTVTPFTQVGQ